jgi:hypothetical protein
MSDGDTCFSCFSGRRVCSNSDQSLPTILNRLFTLTDSFSQSDSMIRNVAVAITMIATLMVHYLHQGMSNAFSLSPVDV